MITNVYSAGKILVYLYLKSSLNDDLGRGVLVWYTIKIIYVNDLKIYDNLIFKLFY